MSAPQERARKMTKNHDTNFRTSEVESTLTTDCDFSCLSCDHSAQRNLSATARYSTSAGSGDTFSASGRYAENSAKESNSKCAEKSVIRSSISFSPNPAFLLISERCSWHSTKIRSGAYNLSSSEKKRSACLLCLEAIRRENKILASTTNSIYRYASGCSSTKRSCIDRFIFFPNSRASFSVSLERETMDLKSFSWETLSWMAALATADQLTSGSASTSCFNSSGTVSVKVAIPAEKAPHFFKPFAA